MKKITTGPCRYGHDIGRYKSGGCIACDRIQKKRRGPTIAREKATVPHAIRKPTTNELWWAAGFLDGEGTFRCREAKGGGGQIVSAAQKDPELLDRLAEIFGGRHGKYLSSISRKGKRFNINIWTINGGRARGVMLTLYKFLSKKRQEEIRRAIR